jgi:hypothetical protein
MEILVAQQLVSLRVVVAEQEEQLLALLVASALTPISLAQRLCMAVVVLVQTDLRGAHLQVAELIPSLQLQIEVVVAHNSPLAAEREVPALPAL